MSCDFIMAEDEAQVGSRKIGVSNQGFDAQGAIFHDSQLSYIGHDCDYIPQHLVKTHSALVRRLDLSFNCLRSIDGAEAFPNLEELILDNNELTDDITIPLLPNLHTLMLNKNNLVDLYSLLGKIKEKLHSLRYLSLLGNEACPNQLSSADKDDEDYQRYRYYVLYQLPKLKFLDSSSVSDKERKEAQRQGPFLKVVRPSEDTAENGKESPDTKDTQYTPLPSQLREEPDHAATFGKCRYIYYGRHSEGNRFIKNNDL